MELSLLAYSRLKKHFISTPIFIEEFSIHAAGAECHSTSLMSTNPFPLLVARYLGSWNCLPYQAHIAPSEPMNRIDQLGSSLGSFPTSPLLYPHFNRPSGFWPCVKPRLVGDVGKYRHVLYEEHPGACSRLRSGAWLCKRNLCMALDLAVLFKP